MSVAMPEMEQLSGLIGDVYDASLDRGLWPSVLDGICGFVGARISCLVSQGSVRRYADVHFTSQLDPRYRQLFVEKYYKINPIFPSVLFLDLEKPYVVADVAPREEFCSTRFSREYLAPQGLVDSVFATLEKSATDCAYLTVMRHGRQGLVDDEARRRFALIV